MSSEPTNAAARLYVILSEARSSPEGSVRDRWKAVLGDKHMNDAELVIGMVAVHTLFDEVEDGLRGAVPNLNENLYIGPLSKLRQAVYFGNLDTNWSSYLAKLGDADMRALAFAADRLSEPPPEPTLDADSLAEILRAVNDLYDEVLRSDTPRPLRRLLLEQLAEIQRAVHLYRVQGVAPIRAALAKTLGVIYANEDVIKKDADKGEVKSFGAVLKRVDEVISLATKAKPLLGPAVEFIRPLLPGG
jgi:hypothetical protein